jgi:hypothetical protein
LNDRDCLILLADLLTRRLFHIRRLEYLNVACVTEVCNGLHIPVLRMIVDCFKFEAVRVKPTDRPSDSSAVYETDGVTEPSSRVSWVTLTPTGS